MTLASGGEKMRKRILRTIGLVSLIVLMMPLAAALTTAPAADGYTHVTYYDYCEPLVIYPHQVTVTLGSSPDTLRVPMDIMWFDERAGSSPPIRHHFQMSTTYGGYYSGSRDKYTTGGMGGPLTDSFYIEVTGVTRSTTMWVLYSVSVYSQSGTILCSVDNSGESPPITFYFV